MQEVFATLVVALAVVLTALVIAGLRVLNIVAGAWAATGGGLWSRARRAAPPEEPAPISRAWPPRSDETFFPTYLSGKDTSADVGAALARARAAVRVDHITAVCRSFHVRCELRDVDGRIHGFVEPDGSVKQT